MATRDEIEQQSKMLLNQVTAAPDLAQTLTPKGRLALALARGDAQWDQVTPSGMQLLGVEAPTPSFGQRVKQFFTPQESPWKGLARGAVEQLSLGYAPTERMFGKPPEHTDVFRTAGGTAGILAPFGLALKGAKMGLQGLGLAARMTPRALSAAELGGASAAVGAAQPGTIEQRAKQAALQGAIGGALGGVLGGRRVGGSIPKLQATSSSLGPSPAAAGVAEMAEAAPKPPPVPRPSAVVYDPVKGRNIRVQTPRLLPREETPPHVDSQLATAPETPIAAALTEAMAPLKQPGFFMRLAEKVLPADAVMWLKASQSPVISDFEALHNTHIHPAIAKYLSMNHPIGQTLVQTTPEQRILTEKAAWEAWHGAGGTPDIADIPKLQQLLTRQDLTPQVRQMATARLGHLTAIEQTAWQAMKGAVSELDGARLQFHRDRWPQIVAAREKLGLEAIPEVFGPYEPRQLAKDTETAYSAARRYSGGLIHDLRQSIGTFQNPREFPTMWHGMHAKNPMLYADPNLSELNYIYDTERMIQTAAYMERLEQKGVIFRELAAARAASGTNQAFRVTDLPGKQGDWWAKNKWEALFLKQALTAPPPPVAAGLLAVNPTTFLNKWARNPNLIWPIPHLVKNMFYKYGLSGGKFGLGGTRVLGDMREFLSALNPELRARFEAVMSFTPDGKISMHLIDEARRKIGGESTWSHLDRWAGNTNQWSSRLLFSKFDPALRYARWKQYVQAGMSDQEAANNVWIDLIRYGMRSDAVDAWKSVPGNFFVPWRVGSVLATTKALYRNPIRTAAFIGGIDLLREIRYRKTGRWTHLPIDYVEGPIAQFIMARSAARDPMGVALNKTFSTLAFGPGSVTPIVFSAWEELQRQERSMTDLGAWAKNIFWGWSQMFNVGEELAQFKQTGDPNHLVNLVMTAATLEHRNLNYEPRRVLGRLVPESVPFFEKDPTVKRAEWLQQQRAQRVLAQQRRQALRPPTTIERKLGQSLTSLETVSTLMGSE